MLITSTTPDSWQELETAVLTILTRSGLSADRGRTIETVRGHVEIDVLATQPVGKRTFTILCECKHWQAAVNQAIVHGFRTVMADAGADRGYIISTGGFQSGAMEAARLSNIRLLTWPEFQSEFEPDYYEYYVRDRLDECLDCLFSFTEPISPATFLASGRLDEERLPEFLKLKDQYVDLTFTCLPMARSGFKLPGEEKLRLPLRQYNIPGAELHFPPALLDLEAWDEFIDALCRVSGEGCAAFRALLRPKP
jgi:hypothetical protein